MRANIVSTALMFLLFVTVPSSAQQTSPPSITPSPLVGQMLGTATDSEPIVELKGYVGPSPPEIVRLSVIKVFETASSAN